MWNGAGPTTPMWVPCDRRSGARVEMCTADLCHTGGLGRPVAGAHREVTLVNTLLGRQCERSLLDQLVDEARVGRSGTVVIRGEAGVGKTALLGYLSERAAKLGFLVARCGGVESESGLAFAGLHDLCSPMLDQLESLFEPQQRAFSIALGITTGDSPDPFLVALATLGLISQAGENQPILCMVDDAQWLDQSSVQILGFVARRLAAEPVALVFASRGAPAPPDHLVGLPNIQLAGLDVQSARALLASMATVRLDDSVRSRILEEAEGNPLALLELAATLETNDLAGGFALPADASVPQRVQEQYLTRLDGLPEESQRLVVLAAADPVGDPALLQRGAQSLGLSLDSMDKAVGAGLLHINGAVRFRHPLLRSAVYSAAAPEDRRAAHAALAQATDSGVDPDRRAWHRAYAASAADETVAAELIGSAGRAMQRGGVAAAAAFWERAVELTPDPQLRATRALTAAEAKYVAADFTAAQNLLAAADIGPLDDFSLARLQAMRARIGFACNRNGDTATMLMLAAQRLEPLDADRALKSYLESLVAVIYAGRLGDKLEVASAAMSARVGKGLPTHPGPLLHGLATRFLDGYEAAAPALKEALRQYRKWPTDFDSLCHPYCLVAIELWDDDAWFELANREVRLSRSNGTLRSLSRGLRRLSLMQVAAGNLADAEALLFDTQRLGPASEPGSALLLASLIAAWHGDASAVTNLTSGLVAEASEHGDGCLLSFAEYATAVLRNGLGDYAAATSAAKRAVEADDFAVSQWARYELVEAAMRSGQADYAFEACWELSTVAEASGTDWARGIAAHAQALLAEGDTADQLYREAVECLSRTRVAAYLARTHLCYGEFLRRAKRRAAAREQLRCAVEIFNRMGANAFAERARCELTATGETARRRNQQSGAVLTAQEQRIAELVRNRLTNSEVGAQLFLSGRTVEWHLRNIFAKLEIRSRRELDGALTRLVGRVGSRRETCWESVGYHREFDSV